MPTDGQVTALLLTHGQPAAALPRLLGQRDRAGFTPLMSCVDGSCPIIWDGFLANLRALLARAGSLGVDAQVGGWVKGKGSRCMHRQPPHRRRCTLSGFFDTASPCLTF